MIESERESTGKRAGERMRLGKISIYPSKWKIRLVSSRFVSIRFVSFALFMAWLLMVTMMMMLMTMMLPKFLLADATDVFVSGWCNSCCCSSASVHLYPLARPFIVIVLVNLYAFFHLSLHNLHGDNDNAKNETRRSGAERSEEDGKKTAAVEKLVLMPLLYCLHCCFLTGVYSIYLRKIQLHLN